MFFIDLLIICLATAMLLGCVLLLIMYLWARRFQVTEETITLAGLHPAFDGTRLFFISDLHLRRLTDAHMEEINAHEAAALVVIGGDVIERGHSFDCCKANLERLRELGPAVFVHGNHDNKADTRTLDNLVESLGIRILDNAAMRCEADDGILWFVGIDDLRSGRTNLACAMEEVVQEPHCTILISHDPAVIKKPIPSEVELLLCGHTHGGQINIPFYGPIRTGAMYRTYRAGWYDIAREGTTPLRLFISQGFGTSHVPLRLFSSPEAHFITLRSK
ncbi:metallophosphoesterase [Paenibacillus aquistagni]|uniref:Predicted phosphohydrolase, MPP superfamily n=1 Tax=Paenibacillus aquistagni TaxID=1852522 RepID=A0A1X7JII1_9BACL|nr:metallophosphoesterase [Paenibacillus aquistagni]SMG27357.1 Predicted phosphohydrolase, MPP superfamily [Paenibacillus aquistagni]